MYMKSFKLATLQKRGLEKVLEIYKENIQLGHSEFALPAPSPIKDELKDKIIPCIQKLAITKKAIMLYNHYISQSEFSNI